MFADFKSVPYLVGSATSLSELRSLLHRARRVADGGEARTLRWLHLGDSRATLPGGNGLALSHALGQALSNLYENTPELILAPGNWTPNAGATSWLRMGTGNNVTAGIIPPAKRPCDWETWNVQGNYGQSFGLVPANQHSLVREMAANALWNDPERVQTHAEVIVATKAFTGAVSCDDDIHVDVRPVDSTVSDFVGAATASADSVGMALSTSPDPFVRYAIGPLNWSGKQNVQVVVKSKTGLSPVELLACRFWNASRTDGVSLMMSGHAGWKFSDFVATCTDLGDVLSELDIDVVSLEFGTNDAFSAGHTATAYKANAAAAIELLTAALPGVQLVLCTGNFRPNLPAQINYAQCLAEYNQYAGALAELCNTYPNATVFNTHRMLWDGGFNDQSERWMTIASAWSGATAYVVGDTVSVANAGVYEATVAGTNRDPLVDTRFWRKIRGLTADGIHLSPTGAVRYAEAMTACVRQLVSEAAQLAADVAEVQAATWAGETHLGVAATGGVVAQIARLP